MSTSDSKKNRWGPGPSDSDAAQALIASSAKAESKKQSSAPANHQKKRPREGHDNKRQGDSYYGPEGHADNEDDEEDPVEKKKANFGLSGALTKDVADTVGGGQVYKGVTLKFQEPPEARTPKMQWRFYVFKGEDQIDTLHVSRQSAYLWGRDGTIADVHIQHPSCSSQHAVLQYRALPNKDGKMACQPYLMDLESTNGSFINDVRIDSARYYQLKSGDVLKFGSSTREYVLLNADSKSA